MIAWWCQRLHHFLCVYMWPALIQGCSIESSRSLWNWRHSVDSLINLRRHTLRQGFSPTHPSFVRLHSYALWMNALMLCIPNATSGTIGMVWGDFMLHKTFISSSVVLPPTHNHHEAAEAPRCRTDELSASDDDFVHFDIQVSVRLMEICVHV